MPKKQMENGETAKESMTKEEKPSRKAKIPLRASMDDILRASRIVMDKGGSVRFGEISTMFGQERHKQNLLGASLGAAVAFGILKPHSGKASYVLSDFGKDFLTEQQVNKQKEMLLPNFLSYEGYRDILIGMRNSEDKSLKKQAITDLWLKIAGGKLGVRKLYTCTFASVGAWCEAIDDSGQTCSLKSDVSDTLSQILKGEKVETERESQTPPPLAPPTSALGQDKSEPQISPEVSKCPICNKPNLVVNERYLDKVPTKGGTLLILERTYQCQGCSNKFIRTVKELVPSPD